MEDRIVAEKDMLDLINSMRSKLKVNTKIISGANARTIKVIESLIKFMQCKTESDVARFLRASGNEEFKEEIGLHMGYEISFSKKAFTELVKTVAASVKKQESLSNSQLVDLIMSYEQLVLEQDKEKERLEEKIQELLSYQEELLYVAKDKARLTAGASKKKFDEMRNATKRLIAKKQSGLDINVEHLKQKLRG